MKVLILAIVLLGAAFASQETVQEVVKRIDQSRFGKTLLDTIYLQLEANEPLERLLGTLDDLENRYIAEQKEDDANNQQFQDACNADISAFDQDLAESNRQRITLEAKLEGDLYPRREIFEGIVKQKEGELRAYNKARDELDAVRAEEAAEFEQKVREHEEATAIITECRRLFTDNLQAPAGEEAFIQKTNKVHPKARLTAQGVQLLQKHFQTAVKRASKFTHRKSWGSIFKALATIATRAEQLADQGAVGRIVVLCDELLEKIEDSLDNERFAEDKRIEAYDKQRNLLTISINVTQTELANAQTELASINDQIAQTEATLDNVNQRIEIVSEKRQDRYDQCEEAVRDYEEARAARDADRQVVSQTIGLVNSQLRGLREQLAARMAAGETFDY